MPSKFKLISDKDKFSCALISKYPYSKVKDVIDEAANAQLDSCEKQYQERLQEIKNRLEEILIHGTPEYWQSFWKGLGV